jgi:hypothetical protein
MQYVFDGKQIRARINQAYIDFLQVRSLIPVHFVLDSPPTNPYH